jgi:ATP:ADP antiporter, AAA family
MNFSRTEKWFLFFVALAGFSISAEYAATRPSSSALFLSTFSSHAIPWVWLISVPINLFIVTLYNRFLPKIGPLKMLGAVGGIVAAVHLFSASFLHLFPKFIFVQFIMKDIYIVLMFKQLWSMIHSTIPRTRAKYLYGCLFGMGTLGAISGSLIPSFFAVALGSEKLFLCTLPLYLIIYFSYRQAYKRSPIQNSFSQDLTHDPRASAAFSLIRRSPFLIAVLLLVIFMQVSVGLMDYQFNAHLEMNILDKDLRTEYVGRMVGLTNALSLALQFLGGFLMVHLFGVRGSHLFIPLMLLGNAALAIAIPSFAIVSFAYVFIKSVDFSLFGVVREMLYIPMKLDEKFRAKAIIDVFAYRSAKALVSICILGLQLLFGQEILGVTSAVSTAVFLGWIAVVFFLFPKTAPAIQVR